MSRNRVSSEFTYWLLNSESSGPELFQLGNVQAKDPGFSEVASMGWNVLPLVSGEDCEHLFATLGILVQIVGVLHQL
ncbi:hypothetical protein CEXT_750791 [Caerostris extrusa]|uniref:Uncharacterized protein n=1 Tax=Caerostris extrusa TaxID=172846 RepID=A0AAV4P0Z1_CAEEX|nr:hypothetical protein CEXT_750791 [Caerostris extrusa]